jgi:hypothetical protein
LGPKAAKLGGNGANSHSDNSNPIFNKAIIIPDCVNDLRYNTVFLADSITFSAQVRTKGPSITAKHEFFQEANRQEKTIPQSVLSYFSLATPMAGSDHRYCDDHCLRDSLHLGIP